MNVAGIPKSIIAANAAVVHELASAAATIRTVSAGSRGAATKIERALDAIAGARAGADQLGADNLLDGAFGRWAQHAERDLKDAASMVQRRGPRSEDGIAIFNQRINDARGSIRLATEAGERSLASPSRRSIERASASTNSVVADTGSAPAWVDGEWLDPLGNPSRGHGGTWSGPDGQSFGWDGTPSHGDSSVVWGPDGATWSGV